MDPKSLEQEVILLRRKLQIKEIELLRARQMEQEDEHQAQPEKLTNDDIARYSRQIIIPQIRLKGQIALKQASVLIVGAGGLGCPSSLYLAGAGIGHIGIVDYDEVELNNLHRQLLHTEVGIGQIKVNSAGVALQRLNSHLHISVYHTQLDSQNALDIIKKYDVVLDATDNVATRYLLNDACVLAGKPLVSGSALQWDGQMTVYNFNDGPCYRCLFPKPPPPEAVTSCGDGGVVGAVPGVIGVLQALETIKIVLKEPGVLSGYLLVFDGSNCTFRNIKLREKSKTCEMCGEKPLISKLIDYEQFCGAKANDKDPKLKLLDSSERISALEFCRLQNRNTPHVLVDVRNPIEFEICNIPGSINIPLCDLEKEETLERLKNCVEEKSTSEFEVPVITLCRRGNDSQRAAIQLKKYFDNRVPVKDVIGGLHAWTKDVDPTFPKY